MPESATAVALLFDDRELGSQLRDALHERGARIVHEGALSTLSRAMLDNTGAEVLVVNLDDDAEQDLDRLYDVIDGDRPRVVFNDAQASRALDGWDRARWARHLAVKVLAQGDLDPPRPPDAPVVHAVAESAHVALGDEAPCVSGATPMFSAGDATDSPVETATPAYSHEPVAMASSNAAAVSESLAAELEALLAADDGTTEAEEFGAGLKFTAEDELPPLHDGHFGVDALMTQGPAPVESEPVAKEAAVVAMPSFQLDHLTLAPLDDSFVPPVVTVTAAATETAREPLMTAASSWALVEDEPAIEQAPPQPSEFGIEKLSAADFLAPEGGSHEESTIELGLSLELVSMEEAIAPKAYEGGHEMLLSDLDTAIGRMLVLGAASDSTEAVCTFLSLLPSDLRMTVLHVQHLDGKSADDQAELLAARSRLPVRVAAHGGRARTGEVLVVPADQQARVYRDGRIELQPLDAHAVQSSLIDASFTMVANVFGRNAQAIVFAGQANDAVGGCQAIHDRGGRVWVEASSEGHFADMVHGIEAERLNSYSGTPADLAARLIEEMSMENRR
ncbi:chemotaxis protein CheB [Dyella halodurans]|uniref:protein-glutamate methylesterase n=1 Tax=Dyella halodurans TaxID=1920171 RepID=A0ABV9C761_9GAMM|nr:chemotaxis protein CheB [Dyella halodurans]